MTTPQRHRGFSLTEVLIAVGTLAIGLTFIGGTFLAGIHLSTVSSERTIAAVVANEAFAKIKLYGVGVYDPNTGYWAIDPNLDGTYQTPFERLDHRFPLPDGIDDPNDPNDPPDDANENLFAYPSTRAPWIDKQYFWSALCRVVSADPGDRLIQVTVFVSRKVLRSGGYVGGSVWPVPVEVAVSAITGATNENMLQIDDATQQSYIGEGATIINGQTGRIHRVLPSDPDYPDVIVLDTPWQDGGAAVSSVWVVPPPPSGGRKPCIAVYQKLIRF